MLSKLNVRATSSGTFSQCENIYSSRSQGLGGCVHSIEISFKSAKSLKVLDLSNGKVFIALAHVEFILLE